VSLLLAILFYIYLTTIHPSAQIIYILLHRAVIAAIAADNARLREELALENRFTIDPSSASVPALVAKLKEESDLVSNQIVDEIKENSQLESNSRLLERRIADQRAQAGGFKAATEHSTALQRRIILLQERLHNALSRRSSAQNVQNQLKDTINGLRKERLLFEDINKKLKREVVYKKYEIMEMIGLISELQEGQGKAVALQNNLISRSEKDTMAWESEWKQLSELVESYREKQMMVRKEEQQKRQEQAAVLLRKDRVRLPGTRSSVGKLLSAKQLGGGGGGGSSSSSSKLAGLPKLLINGKGKKNSSSNENDIERTRVGASSASSHTVHPASTPTTPGQQLEVLEEQLAALAALCHHENAEFLLESFHKSAQSNAEIFSQLQRVNEEVEGVEEKSRQMEKQLIEQRNKVATTKAANGRTQPSPQAALSKAETQACDAEEALEKVKDDLQSLLRTMTDLFLLDSSGDPPQQALLLTLSSEALTNSSLLRHIGFLEQKAIHLSQRYTSLLVWSQQGRKGEEEGEEKAAAIRAKTMMMRTVGKPLEMVVAAPTALPPPPPDKASAAIRARQRQFGGGQRGGERGVVAKKKNKVGGEGEGGVGDRVMAAAAGGASEAMPTNWPVNIAQIREEVVKDMKEKVETAIRVKVT
jgi:coiled-coil domain-containing protein 63/114